jgi:hypothetical protein
MSQPAPSYDLRPSRPSEVVHLFEQFHGYKSIGNAATYCFAVFEEGVPIAAFLWQPPAPGAAKAVCPVAPQGVLALSRMVAVPRDQRRLNHISKPLRRQMRMLIDRTRWPALITYSDASMGHTGHVYKCSGWRQVQTAKRAIYEDAEGRRVSKYSAGKTKLTGKTRVGTAEITRWEHWACDPESAARHMANAGWVREPIPGKFWASGSPAYRWVRRDPLPIHPMHQSLSFLMESNHAR